MKGKGTLGRHSRVILESPCAFQNVVLRVDRNIALEYRGYVINVAMYGKVV